MVKTSVVILAAGKGSRMKSNKPKVMHEVAGAPMVQYVTASASALEPGHMVTVIAPGMEDSVGVAVKPYDYVLQENANGTGHAVLCAHDFLKPWIDGLKDDNALVFIMLGDVPLIRADTLIKMRDEWANNPHKPAIQLLGMRPFDPTGYGRIVCDDDGLAQKIVEQADASDEEAKINLVWSGIMAVRADALFKWLSQVDSNNAQGEIYLTSIIEIAQKAGEKIAVSECDTMQVQGANSKSDLVKIEYFIQQMLRQQHLANGVQMIDPETVYFSIDTQIGRDCVIEPNVFFGRDVVVGESVTIHAFSHLEGVNIGNNAAIGPFARLRPGTVLKDGAAVGNFVETKKATFEKGAKAKHLSYIGDANVGEKANIGAGTITCNYDGYLKHQTNIGAGAFVGANSTLVAPVSIGVDAIVGAGSVITHDVESDDVAVTRAEQIVKKGRAKQYHADKKALKDASKTNSKKAS